MSGAPFVNNWPQARGAIYMIGCAGGGLDQVRLTEFEERFPQDFEELAMTIKMALPSKETYELAHLQVTRVLLGLGLIDGPWEQLRVLIRRAGRDHDIENALYALRRAALDAGLAPSDIQTDWVWSLDAELAGGLARQSLRRAATVFNELFDIPDVLEAGVLPAERIGAPPTYDRQGRPLCPLPPTLSGYLSGKETSKTGLPQVWQAIFVSGAVELPADPSADDLLEPQTWDRIAALPQSTTGVGAASWAQYLLRTKRVLLPYATTALPERLPDRLEAMLTRRTDRSALCALWGAMRAQGVTDAGPEDLLSSAIWEGLWANVPEATKPATWRQYKSRAKKVLNEHCRQTQGDSLP